MAIGALKIINGTHVPIGNYLFAASIQDRGQHICGGSIISQLFILTAAHCVVDEDNEQVDHNYLSVTVGNIYWEDGVKYKISKAFVHTHYDYIEVRNDIALLRTAKEIVMGPTVSTVKLNAIPINDQKNNISATIVGWGLQDKNGELVYYTPDTLYSVDIYVVPLDVCFKVYETMYSSQLCVTSHDSRGSCNGDSGGPLVVKMDEGHEQIGVLSFGGDCNNTDPEVYTRVSSFYAWIRATTKSNKNTR